MLRRILSLNKVWELSCRGSAAFAGFFLWGVEGWLVCRLAGFGLWRGGFDVGVVFGIF